ncbi:segregation/condensation protein A [Streptomyces sp. NPDC006617]|uniref:segregation and condensation protein A n=1 Tax=Streptomyces sp. NPDC006617 TaxID=3155354 RepID=UPI0033B54A90
MTSNDAPRPDRGPHPGRRRALGRGPGAPAAAPLPEETPSGDGASATAGAAPTEQDLRAGRAPAPAGPAAASAGASAADTADPARIRETAAPDAEEYGPGTPGATAPDAQPDPTRPAVDPPPVPEQAPRTADRGRPGPVERPVRAAGAPTGAGAPGEQAEDVSGPQGAASSHGSSQDTSEDAGDGVFKVRLANFEGPFDLLLQLISKHKMDVTEVALSKVTDEFMAHIRAMGPDWDLDQTTEFLVVAATLLDLKAARLLPAAEVEDEADLALLEARDLLFARLLQYRAYKQIAEIFNGRLEAEARRYPRTVGLEPHHAELLPEVVISIGPEGFAKLAVKAMQPKPKPQVYVEHIHAPLVSVQEQAGIVVARLKELGEASFRVLVQDTEDTLTVVARFLALLELYREKAVELDQETALGDLLVRWTGGDGETQPSVTDEFDRPPEAPKEEQKA